mmetsp:Transcript_8424/g.17344  ORF Transcript_8424/g.17344 Transcript_8424/m.17344 type:complete len:241 (+) Transcript_8424:1729-2451(+)
MELSASRALRVARDSRTSLMEKRKQTAAASVSSRRASAPTTAKNMRQFVSNRLRRRVRNTLRVIGGKLMKTDPKAAYLTLSQSGFKDSMDTIQNRPDRVTENFAKQFLLLSFCSAFAVWKGMLPSFRTVAPKLLIFSISAISCTGMTDESWSTYTIFVVTLMETFLTPVRGVKMELMAGISDEQQIPLTCSCDCTIPFRGGFIRADTASPASLRMVAGKPFWSSRALICWAERVDTSCST